MTLAWLLLCLPWWAQQPAGATGRDGNAVIAGRITDGVSGTPVAHAVVRLIDGNGRFVTVAADGDGRYAFPRLTAGRYRVVAHPGEFVASHTARLYEGERTAPNNVIVVDKDQQRTDVNLALPRAYAISGTVLDNEGEPAARVRVEAREAGGGNRVDRTTDDRGEFRIFGLEPGDYVVCARPDSTVGAHPTRDRGRPRLVETCSPSSASAADAAPVTIKASDVEGVDVRLLTSRTFSISGAVVDAAGAPASAATVSLTRFEANGSSSTGGINVDANGGFTFRDVIPGDYAIRALYGDASRGLSGTVAEIAYRRITLGNHDVGDLILPMARTVSVRGQVTLAEAGPAPPDLHRSLRLYARLEGSGPPGMDAPSYGTVNPDLTFELRSLFGKRFVTVVEPVSDWIVKAIRYRGRDILDVPTEFQPVDNPRDLEIVLTNRGAVISGVVSDAAGRPANARVLLVPGDRSRWATMTRADSTMFTGIGQFRLNPQRPGEYAIVAVDSAYRPPEFQDERFFEWVVSAGQMVTLTENDRRTVDLRLTKMPQER